MARYSFSSLKLNIVFWGSVLVSFPFADKFGWKNSWQGLFLYCGLALLSIGLAIQKNCEES